MIRSDLSTDAYVLLQLQLGGDRNFCYLLGDRESGEAAAVDPAFQPGRMVELAAEHELDLRLCLITHGHPDHCGGVARMRELSGRGLLVVAGRQDQVQGAAAAADGELLRLGRMEVTALHTPGHSPGHTCYLAAGNLFTGDILFCGKVGGTGPHFPGSSAEAEWRSLRGLLELPADTRVLPGHDYFGGEGELPHSTIGRERAHNPFLLCRDFAAFAELKENWPAYKRAHGIR